jgi:hypothetical protein
MADKHNMRLLYVSKGISAQKEPEEGKIPEDALVTNVISETPKGKRVLYTCLVKKSSLSRRSWL